MSSSPPRTEPARPLAESIRTQEVLWRIIEVKAEDAWVALQETILAPPRQTMLPRSDT